MDETTRRIVERLRDARVSRNRDYELLTEGPGARGFAIHMSLRSLEDDIARHAEGRDGALTIAPETRVPNALGAHVYRLTLRMETIGAVRTTFLSPGEVELLATSERAGAAVRRARGS